MYDRSFSKFEAKQELINGIEAKMLLTPSKESADEIIKCLQQLSSDEILDSSEVQLQPADSAKDSLSKDFDALANRATELISALEARGDEATAILDKVKFDYSEELKLVSKTKIDLNKIIAAQKISTDKNKSASQVLSSTFREHPTVCPIKINKPDPIKFSGQPRDFATFKRDFEAIIVPHRSAADIGLYMKQAIPSKDLHLITNVDVENHAEMMRILSAEFGTTRQIVDSVVSEISSDKMFLEYVEKLEKINRYLKTMKMVEEVAICLCY